MNVQTLPTNREFLPTFEAAVNKLCANCDEVLAVNVKFPRTFEITRVNETRKVNDLN